MWMGTGVAVGGYNNTHTFIRKFCIQNIGMFHSDIKVCQLTIHVIWNLNYTPLFVTHEAQTAL